MRLAVLSLLIIFFIASSQAAEGDVDWMWKVYYQQIREQSQVKPGQIFAAAAVSTMMQFSGSNENADAYGIHVACKNGVSDTGYIMGNQDFFMAYRAFLESIELKPINPSPQLLRLMQKEKANAVQFQEQAEKLDEEMTTAWATYGERVLKRKLKGSPFEVWRNTKYPNYHAIMSQLKGAMSKLATAQTQYYGDGFRALERAKDKCQLADSQEQKNLYNMAVYTGMDSSLDIAVEPGSKPDEDPDKFFSGFVPASRLPGFKTEFEGSMSGKEMDENVVISVSRDMMAKYDEFQKTEAFAGVFVKAPFFSVGAGAQSTSEQERHSVDTSNFKMKVAWTFIGPFSIDYPWLDASMIANHYDNTFRASTAGHLFNPKNGTFRYIPAMAVIGYAPKFEIQLDHTHFRSARQHFDSDVGAGMSFGPFKIGAMASNTQDSSSMSWDANTNTIKWKPVVAQPWLLGIVGNHMMGGNRGTERARQGHLAGGGTGDNNGYDRMGSDSVATTSGAGGYDAGGVEINSFRVIEGEVTVTFTSDGFTFSKSKGAQFKGNIKFNN